MMRSFLTSFLLLACAASSVRAEDVSAAPPQMPTNTGGQGIQVSAPVVPAGGLNVPGANVGAIDTSAGGSMTRLPGQGATAQTTMGANTTGGASAQTAAGGYVPSRSAASAGQRAQADPISTQPGARAAAGDAQAQTASQSAAARGARREIDQSLGDIQKARQQDAKTGGMSAADEVDKYFRERRSGREVADPSADGDLAASAGGTGGAVRGAFTGPIQAVVEELKIAENAEKIPHDAPAHYEAALARVAQARQDGQISPEDAESLAAIIKRAALANAPSAMTTIAMAAEKSAASGEERKDDDFARAMLGTPAMGSEKSRPASLDGWQAFVAQAGGQVVGLDRVKRELQRVRDASGAGSMGRAKTAALSFIGRGEIVEAGLDGAPVPAVPGDFLSTLSSPSALKAPSLARREQPFDPGFSAFDAYRRLRDDGVAFWPAAEFVARDEARSLWEAFAGKDAPKVSPDVAQELAAKADADYSAGDAKALAADYAALTGDRDAVAAVSAAEAAKVPSARRYWLERLHDLSERSRSAKPSPAEKPAVEASKLASFASYLATHRAEASANVDLIEADASALAALKPVGVVRSAGRDLWVESGVVARGKTRRAVTLAFDAETREPVAGQIAR